MINSFSFLHRHADEGEEGAVSRFLEVYAWLKAKLFHLPLGDGVLEVEDEVGAEGATPCRRQPMNSRNLMMKTSSMIYRQLHSEVEAGVAVGAAEVEEEAPVPGKVGWSWATITKRLVPPTLQSPILTLPADRRVKPGNT